ncbi:LysR family transcriptional regulator [Vibrio sp. ZSDZ34]|uniref:LysR family transcriptional regulator n=1 Tax=Vibrio gelatinilyticus TaxID=2893468 RepID=A0A9X1W7N1_9VIBR|nr:LysR family transcriptional regulator [Vibrio gelatinilyticus]
MAAVDWKKVDLNLLVAFHHLFQESSVSAAAEKTYVSQSAMSHSLSKLRVLCGDRLFERQGHKMVPTDKAQQLAPIIAQVLSLVEFNVLPSSEFIAKEYRGVCRIGLTDYAEFIFAPLLYDAVLASAPHAKVSFVNVNRHNYLSVTEAEKLDIVIGSIPQLNEHFRSQKLYTEKHLCLFDAEHVNVVNDIDLALFTSTPHCLVSPDGHFETKVDEYLRLEGFNRNVTVVSRNFLTIRRLVSGRKLFAIVPRMMAQMSLINDNLNFAPPPVPVADFDISLIWANKKHESDKSQWLREVVYNAIVEEVRHRDL